MYGLTADEWLHLAAEGHGSEVAPCCGTIGTLREWLSILAVSQGEGEAALYQPEVLNAYAAALADHDALADAAAFPLLHRVVAAIRAELENEGEASTP
jgi:hypothetical protein